MDKLTATKRALSITESCLDHLKKKIKPGVTEKYLAHEIRDYFLSKGASSAAFDTLVCSGHRTSLFHGPTSGKVIKNNEPVYVDLGCKYRGYCSDLTRMFYLGKPEQDFLQIYQLVKKAQILQEKALKPGASLKEIDLIARDLFKKAGLDQYFVHSTGHGIGRKVHQKPIISYKRNGRLHPKMIITIEPGIYLPKKFGVRIEDMYLITTTGAQRLSKLTRNIQILSA